MDGVTAMQRQCKSVSQSAVGWSRCMSGERCSTAPSLTERLRWICCALEQQRADPASFFSLLVAVICFVSPRSFPFLPPPSPFFLWCPHAPAVYACSGSTAAAAAAHANHGHPVLPQTGRGDVPQVRPHEQTEKQTDMAAPAQHACSSASAWGSSEGDA